MSNTTRVEAVLPKLKRPFYLRIPVVIAAVVLLAVGGLVFRWVTAPIEAPKALPMNGKCTDVPVKAYIGEGDRDGKSCIWRGQLYWCLYDPNKVLWYCNHVDPPPPTAQVPAEKK